VSVSVATAASVSFSVDQGQSPNILTIQTQQIEREQYTFPASKQQVIEDGPARIIDTRNLAIEDSIFDIQVLADPLRQILEVAERVPIP
jgi:hypothetical protein